MKAITGAEMQALVRACDRPVLVDFWATWCRPCRLMERVLDDVGAQLLDRLEIVKVDVEESAALAHDLHIQGVPTLVLYRDGRPVDSFAGVMPASELRAWLGERLGAA